MKGERLVKLARLTPILALAVLVAGCAGTNAARRAGASVTVEAQTAADIWKGVATPADQDRVGRLALAWQQALADAKPRFARDIDREGLLLKPQAGEARPAPTPGSYHCRMIKIGRSDTKSPIFERFKPFFCYVLVDSEGQLTIVKQTGSQRPAGRLWDDDNPDRMIFLGSLALGDEKEPRGYGEDPERDMAGVFERIAPFRWRLVIPWPRSGAKLEVFELTPVANQPV